MGNEDGQETPEVVIGTEILLAPNRAKKASARQWAVRLKVPGAQSSYCGKSLQGSLAGLGGTSGDSTQRVSTS